MANSFSGFERYINELLAELQPRFRSIVKRRFGIGGASHMTLEAIGKKEHITRERVRQIENDAVKRLKKTDAFERGQAFESALENIINRLGGIVSEEALLNTEDIAALKDKNSILFFLGVSSGITYRKADEVFLARWHTHETPVVKIEEALRALVSELASSKDTLQESDLYARLAGHLRKAGIDHPKPQALATYIGLCRDIERNAWGEYGHVVSPFVRPRGMRESAYVALSRAKQPLHFREIAQRIGEFSGKSVHVQTVHNELIKDGRFVLVGRGLYGLREWGYEPGFVKDVLVKLLAAQGAMTREEILREVTRVRHVKPSTVLINLQNKKLFRLEGDGTYTLIS